MLSKEAVSSQGLGESITWDMILAAREKTWHAVHQIAKLIQPGMTERDAIKLANRHFAEAGVRKFWHKTHVRFGKDTIFSFNDPYDQLDLKLQANDIFYLDVGPIWDGIEGDAGASFVLGHDPIMQACARDAKLVFDKVRDQWLQTKMTGVELCNFAENYAKELGWLFSPDYVKGHRLSEFPHQIYSKARLSDLDFHPASTCWVLEVQIRHPLLEIGAFYEDLLV